MNTRQDAEVLRGQVAHLDAENQRLKQRLATQLQTAVDERVALVLAARKLAPGLRTDGLTDDQVRRSALAATGSILLGMSDEYVRGLFEARTTR